jgi:thiol-disulfide isomerase/thioredoxin
MFWLLKYQKTGKIMKKYFLVPVLILAVMASGENNQIPDFELYDLNRNLKTFEEVKGERLTVIDFWATWCKPCIRAIPKLNELSKAYADEGVSFLGINVDSPRNDAKVKPFAHSLKINYTVVRDPNSAYLSEANVSGLPTLLIVNENREILYIHQGYRAGDEKLIEEEIRKFLAEGNHDEKR